MSIDLSQFHQVFFEESFEGLVVMEDGLLALDTDNMDIEIVNSIFRAAHSIKGGSGTFGFSSVADFTHVLETLLDEVRAGTRQLENDHINLLLKSVDCLRNILRALQDEHEPDVTEASELKAQFEGILNQVSGNETDGDATSETQNVASESTPDDDAVFGEDVAEDDHSWHIYFKPGLDVLKTGNEPIRMIRELDHLAGIQDFKIHTISKFLPSFHEFDPEQSYLAWHIRLDGLLSKEQIEEVFEWVIDESELIIEPWESHMEAFFTDSEEADVTQVTDVQNDHEKEDAKPNNADSVSQLTQNNSSTTPNKPKVAENKTVKKKAAASAGESASIRVSIDKIDSLINMVGELVITQSMLGQLGKDFDLSRVVRLQEGLAQLEHNTRELQESVMKIRMMPISFVFSRFPRLVRDLTQQLNKKINLVVQGEGTELDKTVLERISDPLVHLLRNALDHGIEKPEDRLAAGKSEEGTITLDAFHQGGNIIIQIKDDGAGINPDIIFTKAVEKGVIDEHENLSEEQILELIFHPGFSTANVVSDISGRGVGMDVVRRNIHDLNGTVEVRSELGSGTTFTVRLPLTLAILDGQLVRVGNNTYIFPLVSIVESLQMDMEMINSLGGNSDVLSLRSEYVPIVRLWKVFGVEPDNEDLKNSLIVVVESDSQKIGVVVDELLGQQQVVIKSLEANYQRVEGVSGATILGDGTVALIVDMGGLAKLTSDRIPLAEHGHQAA